MLFRNGEEYVQVAAYLRFAKNWAAADDFIRALDTYNNHESSGCGICGTESFCDKGRILVEDMNDKGQKYRALFNATPMPQQAP